MKLRHAVVYVFGGDRYPGWGTKARALYWLVIRRWETEICQHCGRPVRLVWWCHDDLLWEKVTGKPKPTGSRESASGILCIRCFDTAAKKVCGWIEWAPLNLRHLQTREEQDRSAEARWKLSDERAAPPSSGGR
jgi:hypothetical protein